MKRQLVPALHGIICAGCAVGPNYRRPQIGRPADISGRRRLCQPQEAASIADLKWFEVFQGSELQDLMRTALQQNYDLRDAVARVEEARASLGIIRSNQFPNLAPGPVCKSTACRATALRRLSANPAFSESQLRNGRWDCCPSRSTSGAGCGARPKPRARTCLGAEETTGKAVITTLVSDVATAYLTLRELDYALEISRSAHCNARAVP